jgi:hypothetical protein
MARMTSLAFKPRARLARVSKMEDSLVRFHKGELVAGVIIASDASIRRREYRRQRLTMKRWRERERDAGKAVSVLVCVR